MDVLWSAIVRKRDKGCLVCGRPDNNAAHHVIVRKSACLWTRWRLSNGITLCYQHHMRFVHGNQADYNWWKQFLVTIETKIGHAEIQDIIDTTDRPVEPKRKDLMEIYDNLQSQYRQAFMQ